VSAEIFQKFRTRAGRGPAHAREVLATVAFVVAPARFPTLRAERRHWLSGARVVCGIDEVGRGSWAGPVTVAAVVAPDEHLKGVRDSKVLTPAERQRCAAQVRAWALAVGVGHASHTECDDLGMTEALRRAAERALAVVAAAGFVPDRIILDGSFDYLRRPGQVETIVKGDTSALSVAAASVVAKVTRDAMMAEESEHFPAYGFESNRGYPAPVHRAALNAYGPCSIHRRSWIFMEGLLWGGLQRSPRLFAV
jgi:ribonuclease HII